MDETTTLTLREAAFVFEEKIKDIVRAVDEHSDLTSKAACGNRSLRVLGMPELIYFQALQEIGDLLSPQGRRALHESLVNSYSEEVTAIQVGVFVLPLERLRSKVERRLDARKRLKNSVDGTPDDPRLKGTNVEVYRISALLDGGATVQQVLEDYPSLTPEQIDTARDYAAAIPKKGRPYPKMSFKSASRLLNLSELDDLLAEEHNEAGDSA